ncbi:MAG: ABC transporter permease [Candidatus Bipolaricaulia bacterium]
MVAESLYRRKILRTFLRNKTAVAGAAIASGVALLALLAPLISPYDPIQQNPFYRLTAPEESHLMGTDRYGRDILSRVVWGARVSLIVGVSSVMLGLVAGVAMGMIAAYKGGKVESVIMRITDVMMSFPDEVLGIMIMVVLGSGLLKLIIAIGIMMTPRFARLAHAPTLALREREYIDAARALGVSDLRIIRRHVLPNIFGEVLVMSTLWIATAIRLEANLSFLGLGVSPPTPTWGNMIYEGIDQLRNAWWLSIFPGIAILVTVFSFNLMGDGLRDVTDPKLRA